MNQKKWKPGFFMVAVIVLVVSTIGAWLVASSGGKTRIQRYTVPAENGLNMSYVAFIPENATFDAKAPAVVLFPGRSSNAHQLDNWAIEYARNGYIGITVDWNGNGETDVLSDQTAYVSSLMDSILTMPYIDTENIAVLGNSAGNGAASLACNMYADNVVAYIDDVHPWLLPDLETNTNMLIIEAAHDQYVSNFVGNQEKAFEAVTEAWGLDDTVEEGKYYGSAEDSTLRQFVVTNTIHQVSALDVTGIKASTEFLSHVFPKVKDSVPGGMVFGWYQLFQIFGYAGMIMFVLAFGNLLYEKIPYFHAIGNAPTANKGLRGKKLGKNVLISLAIPLVTFFPISWFFHNCEILNPVFRSRNLRGIIGWLLTNAVINLIITFLKSKKAEKSGNPMTAADYGFAGEGEKLEFYKVGRALLLAVITVFTAYAWVRVVEMRFGINYQIWNVLNISEVPANRMLTAIPFICCNIVIMLAANIGMNTSRRLPETGNPKKDMAKQVVLNVFVSAGIVTILLLVQYGIGWMTSTYIMPQFENVGGGTSSGSLDFAFGFPLIMGFSGGMSTYFYKKTNNIWLGIFISAIFGGLVGVVGSTFITGHAVI